MWIISADNDKALNSYMVSRFEKCYSDIPNDRCSLIAVMTDGKEIVLASYDSAELLDIGFDDLINNAKSVCRRKYVVFSNETAKIIKLSNETEPVEKINVIFDDDEDDINASNEDDFLFSDNKEDNDISDYFFKSSDEEEIFENDVQGSDEEDEGEVTKDDEE